MVIRPNHRNDYTVENFARGVILSAKNLASENMCNIIMVNFAGIYM